MSDLRTSGRRAWRRATIAAGCAAAMGGTLLGCNVGTPAAPEGTEIPVAYLYITRDIPSGDFDAIISATVIDKVSDVPQVGVGVYFRVTGGPGQFTNEGPVITNNHGHAESVLIARGATSSNKVTVDVSSGPTVSSLSMDVNGGFPISADPPTASFTLTPNPPRAGQDATVDVAGSSDPDCPGGDPESWTVDWGDGTTADTGVFTGGNTQAVHRYPAASANTPFTIRVTVEDCTGLDNTATRTGTIAP